METAGKQPDCYGVMWDMAAPECAGCFIKKECERSTKRREEGTTPAEPTEKSSIPAAAVETEEPSETISPLKHLLRSLEGKYDRADKIGEHAIGHFFSKNGKNAILITESKASGRIKIQAKGYERIFDSVVSVEQAEEILKAIPV